MRNDPLRLFTILTRHAVYVESFKAYISESIDDTQKQLREDIVATFSNIKYDSFDEYPKAELDALLIVLRDLQRKAYSSMVQRIIDMIDSFTKADLYVQRSLMGAMEYSDETQSSVGAELADVDPDDVTSDDSADNAAALAYFWKALGTASGTPLAGLPSDSPYSGTGGGNAALIAAISAGIVPADGGTPSDMWLNFQAGAANSITKLIYRAYVNGDTTKSVLDQLIGTADKQFTDGEISKQSNNADSIQRTLTQNASAQVAEGVQAVVADCYQWVSVMDSRTTPICSHRNGLVFRYGNGPVPPAHYRCRSRTVPVPDCSKFVEPDMGDWYASQPDDLKAYGEWYGDKFQTKKTLDIDSYIGKLGEMLQ